MLNRIQARRFKKTAVAIAFAFIAVPAFSATNEELDQPIRVFEPQLENHQETASGLPQTTNAKGVGAIR